MYDSIVKYLQQAACFVGVEPFFVWRVSATDQEQLEDGVSWGDKPSQEDIKHLASIIGMKLGWCMMQLVVDRPGTTIVELELDEQHGKRGDEYFYDVTLAIGFIRHVNTD